MSMQEAETQKQIQQMVNFITSEANDKAQEIEARALEDFNIEKLKLVEQMKNKVRHEYQQKAKQLEMERAIARSTAINKSRLRKIGARNAVVDEILLVASANLAKMAKDSPDKYKTLCSNLLTEAALMLLETELLVRCRPEDEKLMSGCIAAAENEYKSVIQKESGVDKRVKFTIDKENPLPSGPKDVPDSVKACIGGVVVTTTNRKITVDNTLDARLHLVISEFLPEVRRLLFPATH